MDVPLLDLVARVSGGDQVAIAAGIDPAIPQIVAAPCVSEKPEENRWFRHISGDRFLQFDTTPIEATGGLN